jgi:hypothetical protein
MTEKQQHEMMLEETNASGEENWYCPTCGRRMVITWQPWKKIVLEPGDIYAAHSGSKGGLKLGPVQIMQDNQVVGSAESEPSANDPYLAPWQRWLDSLDSDDF